MTPTACVRSQLVHIHPPTGDLANLALTWRGRFTGRKLPLRQEVEYEMPALQLKSHASMPPYANHLLEQSPRAVKHASVLCSGSNVATLPPASVLRSQPVGYRSASLARQRRLRHRQFILLQERLQAAESVTPLLSPTALLLSRMNPDRSRPLHYARRLPTAVRRTTRRLGV